MERQGYGLEALDLIRRAYGAAARLFAGRLQTSGRPFLCHLVGTASVLALFGREPDVVAAGLVHSVYRGVDLGDGSAATASPRHPLIEAVGAPVEAYVFRAARTRRGYRTHRERAEGMDRLDRDVLVILLADELEKLASRNLLYGARAEDTRGRPSGAPAPPRRARRRRAEPCPGRRAARRLSDGGRRRRTSSASEAGSGSAETSRRSRRRSRPPRNRRASSESVMG